MKKFCLFGFFAATSICYQFSASATLLTCANPQSEYKVHFDGLTGKVEKGGQSVGELKCRGNEGVRSWSCASSNNYAAFLKPDDQDEKFMLSLMEGRELVATLTCEIDDKQNI